MLQRMSPVVSKLAASFLAVALVLSLGSFQTAAQAVRPTILVNNLIQVSPSQPLTGQIVQFSINSSLLFATGLSGEQIQVVEWNFGDGRDQITTALEAQYRAFRHAGVYTTNVKIFTTRSMITSSATFSVQDELILVTIANPAVVQISLTQYDTNRNDRLDDNEFFMVLDGWITNQINDRTFFVAVDIWVSDSSIAARLISVRAGSLKASATRVTENGVTFSAQGASYDRIAVQIYSQNGNLVYAQQSAGNRLAWNLKDVAGVPVANGVYFYAMQAYDQNGVLVHSKPQPIAILR